MIKSITFENYKSFKERTALDIKPITIFVGPNSSGKSSLIKLFDILSEIVRDGKYTGSIRELSHRGANQPVEIFFHNNKINNVKGINISVSIDGVEVYYQINDYTVRISERSSFNPIHGKAESKIYDSIIQNLGDDKDDIDTIFKLATGNDIHDKSNKDMILKMLSKKFNIRINMKNSAYQIEPWWKYRDLLSEYIIHGPRMPNEYEIWFVEYFNDNERYMNGKNEDPYRSLNLSGDYYLTPAESDEYSYLMTHVDPDEVERKTLKYLHAKKTNNEIKRIRLDYNFGSENVPPLVQCIKIMKKREDLRRQLLHCALSVVQFRSIGVLYEIYEKTVIPIINDINECYKLITNNITHVPPIRQKPEVRYDDNKLSDILFIDMRNLSKGIKNINDLMKEMGLEYSLTMEKVEDGYQVNIIDNMTGYGQSYSNVGFGLSQIIPILGAVVSAMNNNNQLYMIEQPELHLHPAMQANIARVLLHSLSADMDSDNQNQIIIETHSEHFVKGFQVLIAERAITPNDVIIYYVNKESSGNSTVKEMKINEKGFFIDLWPEGFFDQSYKMSKELLLGRK